MNKPAPDAAKLKDLIKAQEKSKLTKEQIRLINKESRRTKGLYPVVYKGRYWFEKDCAGIFSGFYHCHEAMTYSNCVYVTEGIFAYPDGSTE